MSHCKGSQSRLKIQENGLNQFPRMWEEIGSREGVVGLALEKSKASQWKFYQVLSKSVRVKNFMWYLYCHIIVGSWGPGPPSGWLSLMLFNYESTPMCSHPQEEMKKGWMRIRHPRLIGRITVGMAVLVASFILFCFSQKWEMRSFICAGGGELWGVRRMEEVRYFYYGEWQSIRNYCYSKR